jgi:thiol-disulfide isomerase/thioredoxin
MDNAKEITLDVLASPGCVVCRSFEEFWHSIEKDWPRVKFKHLDVTTPEGQEMASKYVIMAGHSDKRRTFFHGRL